ncbi:MAG TPA: uridine diphosphate-N-acetylglucosamine-binding protein YvcK [Erysipelothrix sp.]
MIEVLVIGGGKGQSALLRGLKDVEGINISAIVTVADDGGSTGRLREDFDLPAMGDVRNVLLSLAESESQLNKVMDYRFETDSRSELAGHSLGNLILTALTEIEGNFMSAIGSMSKILNVEGDIIPASTDIITLCAKMKDGTIVRGESNIPMYKNSIESVFYDEHVEATSQAIEAIEKADIILFGVGSIYTSILPNLIIPNIKKAIKKSTAKKVYYSNVMTQPGETDGYSFEDHISAIEEHADIKLDLVVTSNDELPDNILKKYEEESSYPVYFRNEYHHYEVLFQKLLSFDDLVIRHDHVKVKEGFYEVMEVLSCPLVVKSNTK